ncbi:GntR family transcriptional regulator [Azospira inquinata]|uniref:GntR family transcriptional regulator n=2 Tax=Azospira inquinata TaxID=2785627 RepID=A0A975XUJ0_9RHOO|nr:GntR family transcriptional regulator [Azospira inquinata]QWT45849.1 GntR family transcriptional regulator [Azospira inquinata]QWT48827.1 GntR family transcriptional regulator [Azospira inquinata]
MNRAATTPSPTFSPLYRQIKDLMVRSLELGEWGPGDAIPSESELAARFSVSQGTVRKAIDEMAAENLLVRRQGKGTFVSTHNDPRSLFRFLRLQPNEGEIDQSISEPVECWRAKAGQDVSRVLGLAVGTPITILRRLLSFDGEPALVDEIYLPSDLFPDLSLDVLQHNDMSLYRLYENRYGVRMIRAEERIRAIAADKVNGELLKVPEGSPLLLVERVAFTYGNKPVEWRRGFYATNRYHYFNELS